MDNINNNLTVDILTGEVLEKGNIEDAVNFVNSAEKMVNELTFESVKESSTAQSEKAAEEESTAKKLFFIPRKWSFNPECKNNKGERTIITDMNGKLSEAFCIGDWSWNWTEIQSQPLPLEKNTDYVFTFWLNGGENDRNAETCRLEIIFDNDVKNPYTYKLNRDYVKPVKHYKGWVLFEIPFTTELNDYTMLKFCVMDAPCAILPALSKDAYANLPDEEIDPRIPQRHNIVFKNGFPRDSHWSHLIYGNKNEKANTENKKPNFHFNFGDGNDFKEGFDFSKLGEEISERVSKAMKFDNTDKNFHFDFGDGNEFGENFDFSGIKDTISSVKEMAGNMKSAFKNSFYDNNIDDIMGEIKEEVEDELEDLKDELKDELIEEIREELNNELREEMKESMRAKIMAEIRKNLNN